MSKKYKPQHIKNWLNFVASLGCCVCGSPANIHHIRIDAMPRNDMLVIPLCKYHHQDSRDGIHADPFTWQSLHGYQLDLYAGILEQYFRSVKK